MCITAAQTLTRPPIVTINPPQISKFSPELFLNQKDSPLILVTDHDEFIRKLLCRMLEKEGYQVLVASNSEQCLEAYILFHPDLVILDALMPGIDGFTCCRELRALPEGDRTPILMTTSLNDSDSVRQALKAGATDYITHPIHRSQLCQQVRLLIQPSKLDQQVQQLNTRLESQV